MNQENKYKLVIWNHYTRAEWKFDNQIYAIARAVRHTIEGFNCRVYLTKDWDDSNPERTRIIWESLRDYS